MTRAISHHNEDSNKSSKKKGYPEFHINVEEWVNNRKITHKLISPQFEEQKPNQQRSLDTGQLQQALELLRAL